MKTRRFTSKLWLFAGFSTLIACGGRPLAVSNALGSGESVVVAAMGGSSGGGSAGTDDPGAAASGGAAPATGGGAGLGSGGANETTAGAGGAGTPGADGGAEAMCPPVRTSSLCAQLPTDPVPANSLTDLLALMPGRWILCGYESAWAVDGGDVGVEITADHHWYLLFEAQGGGTVRGTASNEGGTWSALENDAGAAVQVNFDNAGGGTVITSPVFSSTAPRTMHLDNNGVFIGNYVIDPSFPTGNVRCAPQPDPTRLGICTPPGPSLKDVTPPSSAQIVGRWSRCGGMLPDAPPHDGIEFTADGSFFFLHLDASGALVRGTSDTDSGTVKVEPISVYNDVTIFFTTLSGAPIAASVDIYQSTPRQLWLTGSSSPDPDRYTFLSP
jgi:hypothetical protein